MDKEIDKNTTVELVPARDGSWIPTPPLRRNPAARAARVWLRECVNPTAPHQGFLFYRFLAWRTEQIIVTDQRIIRTAGVFTTTVDAVNLDQITDSTYHRSFLGHLFNYGTVRIGSAGQNQTLDRIDFCPDPAAIYRATLRDSALPRRDPA